MNALILSAVWGVVMMFSSFAETESWRAQSCDYRPVRCSGGEYS